MTLTSNIKPRPWWLFFIPSGFWVTINPNIYYPKGVDPSRYPNVIAHEQTHINQQQNGHLWWFIKYVFIRSFRLSQECQAYAAEAQACINLGNTNLALTTISAAADSLASWQYLWAAATPDEAELEINSYLPLFAKR